MYDEDSRLDVNWMTPFLMVAPEMPLLVASAVGALCNDVQEGGHHVSAMEQPLGKVG